MMSKETKKRVEKVIKSSEKALRELDKLINQNIDLTELDPEKAKAAAQGKIEAIEGSFRIIARIEEEENKLNNVKESTKSETESRQVVGVESRF